MSNLILSDASDPQSPWDRRNSLDSSFRTSLMCPPLQSPADHGPEASLLPSPVGNGKLGEKVLMLGRGRRRALSRWAKTLVWVLGIALLAWCVVALGGKLIGKPELGLPTESEEKVEEDSRLEDEQDVDISIPLLSPPSPPVNHHHSDNSPSTDVEFELPTDDKPRAVILFDPDPTGKDHHWTLYMPNSLTYPLSPSTYRKLCNQAHLNSEIVSEILHDGKHPHSHAYYQVDPTFLDPAMLPSHPPLPAETCERSLTYYLTSSSAKHAGMGVSLMGLWLAYGLAQKENRAFFIDDTDWIWGDYNTYFQPPPPPGCLPPPKHLILPCPHSAAHLLLTPEINSEHFGHGFVDEFEVASAQDVFRQEQIFALVRKGYEDLFTLNPKDEALVLASRIEAWKIADEQFGIEDVENEPWNYEGGMVVLHIRHGEAARPKEFWYSKGYLPLARYVDVSIGLIGGAEGPNEEKGADGGSWGPVMLISDDPGVWKEDEMKGAWTAQVEIPPWNFGSTLEETQKPHGAEDEGQIIPVVDPPEVQNTPHSQSDSGLGKRRTVEAQSLPGFSAEALSALEMKDRVRVGRGYLLDLKIAGELAADPGAAGGGGVVCGGYSVTCRLLAVVLGWEKGIVEGRWRDADGWVWEGGEDGEKKVGRGGEWRGWMW